MYLQCTKDDHISRLQNSGQVGDLVEFVLCIVERELCAEQILTKVNIKNIFKILYIYICIYLMYFIFSKIIYELILLQFFLFYFFFFLLHVYLIAQLFNYILLFVLILYNIRRK